MGTRRRRRGPPKAEASVAPTSVDVAQPLDPPEAGSGVSAPPYPVVDIREVEALASALNKSAERLQTLWFTFLTVTLYFAISAGTTTHRMLLLEEGQTLPIINVKLPLLGFYAVAPAFYVVLHAYFLMMLVVLARTAKTFDDALFMTVTDEAARERFRMRVENSLFLQIIVGARRERTGWNGVWLRAIALITLAFAPVMLLVMFQLMFLPYHHDWVTWWHRMLVVADLVLIWTLWPAYMREWGERLLPRWKLSGQMVMKTLASILLLVFSLGMATYPGEQIHANRVAGWVDDVGRWALTKAGWQLPATGSEKFDPGTSDEVIARLKYNAGRISALLFGWDLPVGNLAPDKHGWFPNRLWLPNENLVVDEKLNKLPAEHLRGCPTYKSYSLSLTNRDLTGAVLIGANLKQVDFMGAVVTGATFDVADLENARFEVRAGASASFFRARLQGASFLKAEFPGALFQGARMQGACFLAAKLQGASFEGADLQGASLEMAKLQGASLNRAHLQGASLEGAELQGASLGRANLQASSLIGTELQGASLWESDLRGASLYRAQVWRTQYKPISLDAIDVQNLRHKPVPEDREEALPPFSIWLNRVLDRIPDSDRRKGALDTLSALDPGAKDPKDIIPKEAFWDKLAADQLTDGGYQRALANVLESLVCGDDASPFVTRGLMSSGFFLARPRLAAIGPEHLLRVVERLKKTSRAKPDEASNCPGGRGLTEDDLKQLDALVKSAK